MSLENLTKDLKRGLDDLRTRGIRKGREKVISGLKLAENGFGPRFYLDGHGDREFLAMNSNSYLGLSLHPDVIKAEETATRKFGVGPGAVRFICGTFQPHIELENRLAAFHGREAAMIFSAAYAAVMGVLPQLIDQDTIVLSDALNHNSIINAIRLARPIDKDIYRHLDMADLETKLKQFAGRARRLLVVTDGIFSMRGDCVPLAELTGLCRKYETEFPGGIITVVDDSHGVGAFGATGRGTEEYAGAQADILVATLGKAFGVNGGYAVANRTVIEYLRETAPFYVYSNPITPAEAAAAHRAVDLVDSGAGRELLAKIQHLTNRFEQGLTELGYEFLAGPHPIVPLMIRDTEKTAVLVDRLFDQGILATGLNYPVVPKGDEEIRFQISALHTKKDIDRVLEVLKKER